MDVRIKRLQLAGVPLLVLFMVLNVSVCVGLTQGFDVVSFRALNSWSPSVFFDSVIIIFSLYGREVVWGGAIVVLFFLGARREKEAAITLGLVFMILIGVGYGVKAFDVRSRPYDVLSGIRLLIGKEPDVGSLQATH